jgi:hypothetical protein
VITWSERLFVVLCVDMTSKRSKIVLTEAVVRAAPQSSNLFKLPITILASIVSFAVPCTFTVMQKTHTTPYMPFRCKEYMELRQINKWFTLNIIQPWSTFTDYNPGVTRFEMTNDEGAGVGKCMHESSDPLSWSQLKVGRLNPGHCIELTVDLCKYPVNSIQMKHPVKQGDTDRSPCWFKDVHALLDRLLGHQVKEYTTTLSIILKNMPTGLSLKQWPTWIEHGPLTRWISRLTNIKIQSPKEEVYGSSWIENTKARFARWINNRYRKKYDDYEKLPNVAINDILPLRDKACIRCFELIPLAYPSYCQVPKCLGGHWICMACYTPQDVYWVNIIDVPLSIVGAYVHPACMDEPVQSCIMGSDECQGYQEDTGLVCGFHMKQCTMCNGLCPVLDESTTSFGRAIVRGRTNCNLCLL